MSLDVVASIDIDRPPEVVADYEFEPEHDANWIGGVRTAERLTNGPIGVGSRVRRRGGFLGRPIEWVMDIVVLEPARRLAMHAVKSPFPMDVTYELAPHGRGTMARIRIQGETKGVYGLLGPLTPWMVRRSVQSDLRRLKRQVETRSEGS
jgi:uncharacterized protein YndB with AHSA1/START domain